MAMLEVKNINVYYGSIHAIKDISFEVQQGEARAKAPRCKRSRA